jgi:hypothetical protein
MCVFLKERVFYPIKYGADPTGERDSSDAILKALSYAFQVQNELELLPGINDLAGVVIDLQGGNYKISKPIRFPAGGGNILVSIYPVLFILIHKQRYFTYRSSFLECT